MGSDTLGLAPILCIHGVPRCNATRYFSLICDRVTRASNRIRVERTRNEDKENSKNILLS